MEADLKRKNMYNIDKLDDKSYKKLELFAKDLITKYKGKVSSIIINKTSPDARSVGVLIIVDDFNNIVFDQQVADMKVSASEMAYSTGLPLSCEFMLASLVWDGFRSRDEGTLQIMRDALVVHDSGFFLPLQDLLATGKVRPSKEGVNIYFVKAEQSMKTSSQHVAKAVLDLYWAVTDAAHAAVMVAGMTPPSPKDLADAVKKELVVRNLVNKRCGEIVERFYEAAKQIMHKERFEISGREFDSYLADADFFIKEIDEFVKEHMK